MTHVLFEYFSHLATIVETTHEFTVHAKNKSIVVGFSIGKILKQILQFIFQNISLDLSSSDKTQTSKQL